MLSIMYLDYVRAVRYSELPCRIYVATIFAHESEGVFVGTVVKAYLRNGIFLEFAFR